VGTREALVVSQMREIIREYYRKEGFEVDVSHASL